ncbi:MAG TPA: hypothetical protein EYQ83_03350, partial [Acidobacteria bacterium]|nr:hypothetical protein [Acidobacteriota bacterium]
MGEPLQFGRYTVKGLLGRGTMGIVYRAEDPVISRQVAIKTLHKGVAALQSSTQRDQRVTQRLGLRHPAVSVCQHELGGMPPPPCLIQWLLAFSAFMCI